MDINIEKLYKEVLSFCKEPGPLIFDDNKELLVELLKAFFKEESSQKRNQLLQMIVVVRKASETDITVYAHTLSSIAFEEYGKGYVDFAEFLFRSACNLTDDVMTSNNLAYILRRMDKRNLLIDSEVIDLLKEGVRTRNPYSLINMGLHFSMNFMSVDDWKTADTLFSLIPDDLQGADAWWEKVGEEGEIEGYLVHFFLLRYNKIEESNLGSARYIAHKLRVELKGFPDSFANEFTVNSLEQVMDCIGDSDFAAVLETYLNNLPISRESAVEIIQMTKAYDEVSLYMKLFDAYSKLLTDAEKVELEDSFKEKFDIPMPDWS